MYHLRVGERIVGLLENLAFEDVADLLQPFAIKNTKAQIDTMIERIKRKDTKPA